MKKSQSDKNWFIIFSVMFAFGLVWAIVGDEWTKVAFATLSFELFLYSGIKMELNALHSKKAH